MKTVAACMTALMLMGGIAMAQAPATVDGTKTAPSNGAGMPGATAPTGTVSTTTVVPTVSGGTASTTTTPPAK